MVIFRAGGSEFSGKSLGEAPNGLVGKLPDSRENQRVRGEYHVFGAARRQIHEHTRSQHHEEDNHVCNDGEIHTTVN
jgi:hypothetical protein